MILLILILLFLLLGGFGFILHLLWIAAVIVLLYALFHAITRNNSRV